MSRRDLILERILQRIEIVDRGYKRNGEPSPCWEWTGPTSGNGRGGGYGRMSLNGHTVATHLVMYTHQHGYIPGNKQVDHTCCNRLCCNPDHLELVSQKQNCKRRDARIKETRNEALSISMPAPACRLLQYSDGD